MTGIAIHEQSAAVKQMAEVWPMIEALLGGTHVMRNHPQFLPKEDREDQAGYDYRARVATLYPAFKRTISVMGGKPFSKKLTFNKDTPAKIVKISENIDGQGRNLHSFFFDVFDEILGPGIGGVLVDTPKLISQEGAVVTQADVNAQGATPYFAFIKHGDILGWKWQINAGQMELMQLRILEQIEVDDGPYGTGIQEAVRVLTPGRWELWKKSGTGDHVLDPKDQGNTGLAKIPYVPFYGRRKGFMIGESPLLDLAFMNVKHYQVQSDQDDSARFARKRLLVFIGVDARKQNEIEASSSSSIVLETGGSVEVVQGSAESVTVGRNELSDLEEQMVRSGAELLVIKPSGQRTATQDNNEAEGNKSELQRIVETFEDSVDQCLQFLADFLGEKQGGHVEMFKDFNAANLTDASAQIVLSMQQSGLLTKVTTIKEQQRRGLVSAEIDPDKELELVAAEGPALGTVGLDAFGNPLPVPPPGSPVPPPPPGSPVPPPTPPPGA